jgi:hypothetical protein
MPAKMNHSKLFSLFTLLCTLCFFGGCATFTQQTTAKDSKKGESKWPWSKEKEYQMPRSMAVIWSPDVFVAPGATPSRGFGGRIYFYNEKSQAVPVDGELIVHGYDETTRHAAGANPAKADKTFRFTSEQFTQHFSESQLGASYSIWIPWDQEAEGTSRKIVLIPTFVGKDGKVVRGDSSQVVLQGTIANEAQVPQDPMAPLREAMRSPSDQGSAVQAASYHADILRVDPPDHANRIPSSGLRTTTISIPSTSSGRRAGSVALPPSQLDSKPLSYPVQPAIQVAPSTSSVSPAGWQNVPSFEPMGRVSDGTVVPSSNPPATATGSQSGSPARSLPKPQPMPAWGRPWPQVDHRPMEYSGGWNGAVVNQGTMP